MAFVSEFFELPEPAQRPRPRTTVRCGWRIVEIEGERLIQLDTHGSSDRQEVGTVSQTLRLDAKHAAELIDLLKAAFPELHGR